MNVAAAHDFVHECKHGQLWLQNHYSTGCESPIRSVQHCMTITDRQMVWGIVNWHNTVLKSVVKYHYIFWIILCIPVFTADVTIGDVG